MIGIEGTTNVPCQLIIKGTLELIGYVSIYKGVKIVVDNDGLLRIGAGTYINEYTRIFAHNSIIIGNRCAISWNVVIIDTDIHSINKKDIVINPDKSITIGNNVWIGFNSTISKGTFIGDNVIVGSNSFVHGLLNNNHIYYGTPIKNQGSFDEWV